MFDKNNQEDIEEGFPSEKEVKKEEVDWDFFFDKETFDEEAELKMNSNEWNLMDEWTEYMSDFVPEDMSTFQVAPKKTEAIFEPIEEDKLKYIRGAYFVKKDKSIDFYILDPKKRVVFSRRNQHEGIFRFNTTLEGDYRFVLTNKDKEEPIDITLALHTELLSPAPQTQSPNDEMHPELEAMQSHISRMRKEVRNLQNFQRSSLLQIRSHND